MEFDEPSPRSEPAAQPYLTYNNTNTLPTAAGIPTRTHIPPAEASFSDAPANEPDNLTPLRPPFGRANSNDDPAGRRTSVQFLAQVQVEGGMERSRSRKPIRESQGRRLSSPPPPEQFKPRVSFDTFDNRDAADFSLTLSRKHKDYVYSKRSRTFLCGTDINEHSDTALEWLFDELVDDGDEVVCLRVIEKDSREAREWATMSKDAREKAYRADAQRMLVRIQEKNTEDRAINLVLEFSTGKIQETIQRMIRMYEPAMLVVGTKGKSLSGFQGLMPGSVSKYCLQHSPVPVIVVRPSSKRDKKKRKRMQDPSRRGYRDILDKSEDVAEGGHILDQRNRRSMLGPETLAELDARDAEEEARMVAEAIGYRPNQLSSNTEGHSLSRVVSGRSDISTRSARSGSLGSYTSETAGSEANRALMKSPELRDLDSPMASEYGESEDEEVEAVPEYVRAQEEALMKARERAIKAEEEEKEREAERLSKENEKPKGKGKKGRAAASDDYHGASGALAMLDALEGEKKGKR